MAFQIPSRRFPYARLFLKRQANWESPAIRISMRLNRMAVKPFILHENLS